MRLDHFLFLPLVALWGGDLLFRLQKARVFKVLGPLLPFFGIGVLGGILLAIGCTRWLRHRAGDANGQIRVGLAWPLATLFGLLSLQAATWLYNRGILPGPCTLLWNQDRLCDEKYFLFQAAVVFLFLLWVYVWGLRHERKTGQRVTYTIL